MSTERHVAIERSRAFVILIPRTAPDAQMVEDIGRARRAGKPIIAVLRAGYSMPQGLDDAHVVHADTPAAMADAIKTLLEEMP